MGELEKIKQELEAAREKIAKLEAEKKEAIKANNLKSLFLANMSHEIRTPLNAISGFSKIVSESEDEKEKQKYGKIIESSNNRLQSLINEILDISKIEAGTISINPVEMELNSMCEEIENLYKYRCNSNVKLLCTNDLSKNICIEADRNRLMQVLSNLVGNAIKHTSSGKIEFGYEIDKDKITFFVSDTGHGIPKDCINKIFDLYVTYDSKENGTGLGLALCKMIVEKLGGTIKVHSENGIGTTFTFTTPYKLLDGENIEAPKEKEEKSKEPTVEVNKDVTILVAEDNEFNWDLINAAIGKTYNLIRANDGIEAVTLNEKYRPQIILMDIKMPNMNGIDAAKIIHEVAPAKPIVAVSAYAFNNEKQVALDNGCCEFISKPFKVEDLKEVIKKHLEENK